MNNECEIEWIAEDEHRTDRFAVLAVGWFWEKPLNMSEYSLLIESCI